MAGQRIFHFFMRVLQGLDVLCHDVADGVFKVAVHRFLDGGNGVINLVRRDVGGLYRLSFAVRN